MFKHDLALNNQQCLICHNPPQKTPNQFYLLQNYFPQKITQTKTWLALLKTMLKVFN